MGNYRTVISVGKYFRNNQVVKLISNPCTIRQLQLLLDKIGQKLYLGYREFFFGLPDFHYSPLSPAEESSLLNSNVLSIIVLYQSNSSRSKSYQSTTTLSSPSFIMIPLLSSSISLESRSLNFRPSFKTTSAP